MSHEELNLKTETFAKKSEFRFNSLPNAGACDQERMNQLPLFEN
jgi:hypothetical protein